MEDIFRLVSESLARHETYTTDSEVAPPLSRSLRQGGSVDFPVVDGQCRVLAYELEVEKFEGAPDLPAIRRTEKEGPLLDHPSLQWSRWFRCESSFSVLLVPAKPGIFALGEEIVRVTDGEDRRRMLALFQISETDDLGMALGRMFLPGNPLLRKLNSGRCFARYAVIEDATQRSAAYTAFQRWMQDSGETVSGISPRGAGAPALDPETCGADTPVREGAPSLSSVNFARQGGYVDFPCGSDTPVRAETINDVTPDSDLVQTVPPSISSAWGAGFMEVQNREAKEVVRRPTPLPSGF